MMIHMLRAGTPALLRGTAAVIAAFVLVVTIAPSSPHASADQQKRVVFGTVSGISGKDLIDIATRDGVITLKIDEDTKILDKKGKLKRSKVKVGMTTAGYYVDSDDGPVAITLTFVKRKLKKSFEHVIGVIVDRTDSTFTVKSLNGDLVVIGIGDDHESEDIELGSMVATVVQRDEITGDLASSALQTARKTVERLSKSISYEISLAQRDLLKIRMSATAAVHMARLYETLDEIEADAQVKIRAAYAEFQAGYESTLKENLAEALTLQMTGEVLSVFGSEVHVRSLSDGTLWDLFITDETKVVLVDGGEGTIVDIAVGQIVEIKAVPAAPPNWPRTKSIRILPEVAAAADSNAFPEPADGTIVGTIILVESETDSNETVVVVVLDDGTDTAASLTEDTVIIVDGEELTADDLEAGQEVQIVLTDDGFSAEEVTAVEPKPKLSKIQGNGTETVATAPIEYSIIGTVRQIDAFGLILDGVRLILGDDSTTWDVSKIGQEVEMKFYIDRRGRLVVTGTK